MPAYTTTVVALISLTLFSLLPPSSAGNIPSAPKPPNPGDYSLDCDGELPTEGYIYPFERKDFTSVTQLCGFPYVGCVCHSDGTLECSVDYGMSKIYRPFNLLCHASCKCLSANTASSSGAQRVDTAIDMTGAGICPLDSSDEEGACAATDMGGTSVSAAQTTQQHQCQGSCSSVSRGCSWAYLGECICTAPKIGLLFLAQGACARVHHRPGGKRDVAGIGGGMNSTTPSINATDNVVYNTTTGLWNATSGERVACACNGTYISYACCNSRTGIIWEDASLRLPQLP